MCHEAEFKGIVMVYKELRKDGVVFPMREANNQFLIDFKGKKSPIFETIEGGKIYEEPNKQLSSRKYKVKGVDPTDKGGGKKSEVYGLLIRRHESELYQPKQQLR